MKKFISIVVLVLCVMSSVFAQDKNVKKEGNVFSYEKVTKAPDKGIETGFMWKDSKDVEYPIMLTAKGKAFVWKVSKKTGNEYKYYLADDIRDSILESKPALRDKISIPEKK